MISSSYIIILLIAAVCVAVIFSAKHLCLTLITKAAALGLVSKPNERSSHITPTAAGGGLAFILPVSVAAICFLPFTTLSPIWLMCILGFCLLGYLDDLKNLSSLKKLGIQTLLALAWLGTHPECLFNTIPLTGYPLPYALSFLIHLFFLVGFINAFNLIDGINGLAGGMALLNSMLFAISFMFLGGMSYALFFLFLAFALTGYLPFNWKKAKLFMGDTGALPLGFIFGSGVLELLSTTAEHPIVIPLVFALIFIPTWDTLRVFIKRIMQKKSPFSADKSHIHHLLLKLGFNHQTAALSILSSHFILLLMATTLSFSNLAAHLTCIVLFFGGFFLHELLNVLKIKKNYALLKKAYYSKKQLMLHNTFIKRYEHN